MHVVYVYLLSSVLWGPNVGNPHTLLANISCLFSMIRMSFYRVYQCKVSFISALLFLIPTGPTAMTSKFVGYFIEQVSDWQKKLATADSVITIWFEVQLTWSHLESIFIGSEDIRAQLPEHSKQFDNIDADFKASSNIKCTVSYVTLRWASLLGLITDQCMATELYSYVSCKHYLCES